MSDPIPVAVSLRIYRILLRAYPQQYRLEYSEAMLQVFRDLCLRGGSKELVGVWGRTMLDYIVSLVSEHMDRGVVMTKSKWIQISGWGFVASSAVFLAGLLASSRPTYNPYNAAAWPIDPFLNQAGVFLLALAMMFISAGMAGILARFQDHLDMAGKAAVVLGIAGGLVSAAGAVGSSLWVNKPWWYSFMLGLVAVNLALAVFGLICLRKRLFARWNGLPLIMGLLVLVPVLISAGSGEWIDQIATLIFSLFAIGLALVGYRLQLESKEVVSSAI